MASPQLLVLLLLPLAANAQRDILMVFGGYTSEDFGTFLDTTESVELGGDGTCTRPLTPMPFGTDQNIGLVNSDGQAMSCGGQLSPDQGLCIIYNKETETWEDGPNMRYARSAGASSVKLTDGRYLIIGETGDDPATTNSEIFDGQEFLDGPVLPFSAWDACVVEFSPNVVFITGSYVTRELSYLIDVDSGEVTMLPPHPYTGKWFPACGVVDSPALGGKDIVVAGGNDQATVAIYNTEQGVWRPGARLPYAIEGSGYAPFEDSFILVGGRDDIRNLNLNTIYQYDPVAEDWVLRDETILDGKGSFAMVMADENSLNC